MVDKERERRQAEVSMDMVANGSVMMRLRTQGMHDVAMQ